ncbi:MAG: hypothetical protein QOJ86_4608 [Bradyrhizobium sp.]|jgi:pimeloyl-ACP methyl ester carboxylesterase|nr:hypothetical protein [Bradyrhizobium sp.]
MPYAFDEFQRIVSKLPTPVSDRDPVVRYVCALVAELAYYHVPQFEIDNKKRAMIIPCEGYRAIVARGVATNIGVYLQGLDLPNAFVVVDRGIIAVGLFLNGLLFIGFRGTQFLFDWQINLRAPLTAVSSDFFRGSFRGHYFQGRVHRGFAEEAVRISSKIVDALRDKGITQVDHVFLAGHSLGGAVAALSEHLLRFNGSTIMMGAPRYCDVSTYYASLIGPPTQIARMGDIVPFVPPRSVGYADHPYEFDTSGAAVVRSFVQSSIPYFIWRLALFVGKRFEPHSMEMYRRELGITARVPSAGEALAPYEKLTSAVVH